MSTVVKSPPKFTITRGTARKAHRTMVYGVGGIGKTSLAASAPGVVMIDLEGGTEDIDVQRVSGIKTWADLRAVLHSDVFDNAKAIGIDSFSRAEEMCRQHVIETVRTDKGNVVTSIEGYGFGKGYTHLVEEWRRLLADLEVHYGKGRDIVAVAHGNIGKTPNPTGDDYIRHEPRLTHVEKASVRNVTIEWCDHVLFIGYDVASIDGKGKGSGSRAIYSTEEATHIAKSRTLDPKPYVFNKGDASIWDKMRNQSNPVPAF